VAVLNNGDLNMVTWEQRAMGGEPRFEASQALPDFSYAAYARLLGLAGRRVENPEEIGAAWDEALGADRPMLLEFVTDPDVPPLGPHADMKQVRAYLAALRREGPGAAELLRATLRQWWA